MASKSNFIVPLSDDSDDLSHLGGRGALLAHMAAAGLPGARLPKEEKLMLEDFVDEYQAYIQRTGKHIPKL